MRQDQLRDHRSTAIGLYVPLHRLPALDQQRLLDGAGLPQWIRPQLTELVNEAPEGSGWLHEIKFDGYRMHARLDRGVLRLLTRTRLDWTHKYPAIAAAVASLPARESLPYFSLRLFNLTRALVICGGVTIIAVSTARRG